jgi:hypothetical protein
MKKSESGGIFIKSACRTPKAKMLRLFYDKRMFYSFVNGCLLAIWTKLNMHGKKICLQIAVQGSFGLIEIVSRPENSQ